MKNAFTFRNVLCGGALYAALGFVQIATAGFASASPPPGFSNTPDGMAYRGQWINGSARAYTEVNVAGTRVQIPVNFQVSAARAPLLAARHLFRHPALAAATLLVPLGLEFINGQWNRTSQDAPISDGASVLQREIQQCNEAILLHHGAGYCTLVPYRDWYKVRRVAPGWAPGYHFAPCPTGWTSSVSVGFPLCSPPPGTHPQPVTRALTVEEFVPLVAPRISPAQVPDILPNYLPIPVERPALSAVTVPLSNPVMVPGTSPQQWRQPLVQVMPSPTASDPFRVTLNKVYSITTSPYGITEPVANVDPAAPPAPNSDFCIRNPGALACMPAPVLDVPADQIPTATALITYQPEHFLGGGSCPRPVTVNLGGTTITAFDTPVYCQFISSYFRPVLLAIAAFTSMMIVAGGFRSV